jgi:hypothetical protein
MVSLLVHCESLFVIAGLERLLYALVCGLIVHRHVFDSILFVLSGGWLISQYLSLLRLSAWLIVIARSVGGYAMLVLGTRVSRSLCIRR